MFEATPTESVLAQVRAHEFDADPVLEVGHHRIEAIKSLDRLMRAAQAEQVAQIAALHAERTRLMGLGVGDPSLSVIGEVAMARNIGPTAAGTQLGLALTMARMPAVFALFSNGVISEATARAVATRRMRRSAGCSPIRSTAPWWCVNHAGGASIAPPPPTSAPATAGVASPGAICRSATTTTSRTTSSVGSRLPRTVRASVPGRTP